MRKAFVTLLLLALAFMPAHAQRTAKGERFISLSGDYILVNGVGGTLGAGLYTMDGFWDAAVDVTLQEYGLGSEPAGCGRYLASAGYMARLLSTRSRSLSVYGGGAILMGAGTMSTTESGWIYLNENADTEWFADQTYFLYGLCPKVELEMFMSGNLAFDLAVKTPLVIHPTKYSAIQSMTGIIHCQVSAGFKYNF